ncbi:hypothetical protein yinte0001_40000 [Yersinia intermedia ATCC 29909]|jgi:hypothetical protein|nr:hypothetical protein yinte0001_40000 [Yersinia intermedia ATCC 29909]
MMKVIGVTAFMPARRLNLKDEAHSPNELAQVSYSGQKSH